MKRLLQCAALFAAFSLLPGCGGATGTLSGKVTLDGQPVTTGTVLFTNGNSAQNAMVSIQSDGTYKAEGVAVGDMKVGVTAPPPNASSMPKGAKGPPPGIPADHPQAKLYSQGSTTPGFDIPKEYSNPETSNLTVKVEGGQQTYDIALKSK
jgi:hypothetical protein